MAGYILTYLVINVIKYCKEGTRQVIGLWCNQRSPMVRISKDFRWFEHNRQPQAPWFCKILLVDMAPTYPNIIILLYCNCIILVVIFINYIVILVFVLDKEEYKLECVHWQYIRILKKVSSLAKEVWLIIM